MGRLDGKVAFITGAARGQGRSHALTLAREGADIIALDFNRDLDSVPYPLATAADLEETVRSVEALDRRILAREADVRDLAAVTAVVEDGLAEFGHVDIVCANAGIASAEPAVDVPEQVWRDIIDVNLTGVWFTVQPVLRPMIERGKGGSIILTSSIFGVKGPTANLIHYTAAKHGVVGIMRQLAHELAPHMIRVNTVNPTVVQTGMMENEAMMRLFLPEEADPTQQQYEDAMQTLHPMPVPWIQAQDVSNTVLYLASDDARYVTGTTALIDLGAVAK